VIQTHRKTSCRIIHELILQQFLSSEQSVTPFLKMWDPIMKNTTSWASWVHAAVPYWLSRISGYSPTVFITYFGLCYWQGGYELWGGDIVLLSLIRAASPLQRSAHSASMWPTKNVSHIQV
jgi:hypothetical protein